MTRIITLSLLLFSSLQNLAQTTFELKNKVYDPYIKTVKLYPQGVNSSAQLASAAINLRGTHQLILEFDELFNDVFTYQVKYVRCDANWTQSQLSDLEFLSSYNEFTVDEFEYSFNTLTPYVHYKTILPRPKLTGNYVLVVYADGDESDVIITRRFIVYENKAAFSEEQGFSSQNQASRFNQLINFELTYNGIPIQNPRDQVSITILQNQRWDNAHYNLKPTFIREGEHKLEYRYFTEETMFTGGNEFRFFDIRSLRYFGENVKTVHFETDKIFSWIEDDKPRSGLAYSIPLLEDLNGKFVISNTEGKNPIIENDYSKVEFTLQSPKIDGNIYIGGELTNWEKNTDNKLTYDNTTESYKGSLILKQGWYSYQYIVESNTLDSNFLEGNWSATNNQYEVIVYFRPYNLPTDLIIGYLNLNQ